LLKAAIRCDDPVVFLEHKELWATSAEVDPQAGPLPIGVARLVRPGADATLVTWSSTLGRALEAADALAQSGISLEVVDLRTLWPWDRDTVFASVRKTGRLVVAHESVRVGGFGAELVAEVAQTMFPALKAAPVRVASPRAPVPYAKPLEDMCRVSADMIAAAVREMLPADPSGPLAGT